MYRRILSLLLPLLLLSQSATFGNAHGGMEPFGHSYLPHFHIGSASHGHQRQGVDESADREPESTPPFGHDSDAVYLSAVDAVTNTRSAVDYDLVVLFDWAVTGLFLPVILETESSREIAYGTHTRPLCGHACPLYLRHLSLLI